MVAALAAGVYAYRHRPIRLPTDDPTGMTISIAAEYGSKDPPFSVTIHDATQIRQFLVLLKTGRGNTDHKCVDRGTIVLKYNNTEVRIDFLPGHNPRHYELRYNRNNFRIERNKFVEELKKLGVPAEKIPLSC